jgi:putative polyketide hydroxylase
MSIRHVPVLIVGAGFAGLTAAVLLALRGVPCLVVERRASINRHPRAHGVSLRSMELLRVVPGLEADLCKASRAAPHDSMVMIAESLAGPVIKTLTTPGGSNGRAFSPATVCSAGQDRVEPILLSHARALGAEIHFSAELEEFTQDADGVEASLRDLRSGDRMVCRADYLIAADGAHSQIRDSLGVEMQGRGTLSHAVSILFKADLKAVLPTQAFLLCYLQNREFTGAFVTTDDPDVAQLNIEYDPVRENVASYDQSRCSEIVRAALGAPELGVQVLEILPWKMSSLLTPHMAQGRVFLAGDAAHIMPPVGGLAGQAAIQDGADLAWKLAMIIHGQAGRALLDTYDAERRPVARLTTARMTANYVERLRPDRLELLEDGIKAVDNFSVATSYRYLSAAVTMDDDDNGEFVEDARSPTGRPGSRTPHILFLRNGVKISSLDLIGRGFVLLAAPGGARWITAAQELSQFRGAPVETYQIDSDLIDVEGAFLASSGIECGGALLIRPDGFIAWRSRIGVADPAAILEGALKRALCIESLAWIPNARLRVPESASGRP